MVVVTAFYPPRPCASLSRTLIALESDCLFSLTVIEPCQNRGHVSYSWWLAEGNPTNICSVTNQMKRLMAKHAWRPPVIEYSEGLHSSTQETFHYSEYPFEKKPHLKKKSIFYFESPTASFHPSSCGVGTLFSLTFKKGQVKIYGVLHPESVRHPLRAASPHFSRWTFFPFILCTRLIIEFSGLHLWCVFFVET